MADEYDYHPVCLLFPELSPEHYARRLADYRKHPERANDTAVLLAVDETDGNWKILDGRHHYRICRELGYQCSFERVEGDRDTLADIAEARGINRRHQTETQIAAVVVGLNEFRGRGRPDKSAPGPIKSQAQLAASSGVSERTLRRASAAAKAEPELLPAMRDGKIDAKTADKVAKLPKPARKRIAKAADPKAAAKKELAKPKQPEPEEPAPCPPVDHGAVFVDSVEVLCRKTDQIVKEYKALKESPFAHSIHLDSAISQIEAARKTLWVGRPAHVCPYCDGTDSAECKPCRGSGRVSRTTFDAGVAAKGGK